MKIFRWINNEEGSTLLMVLVMSVVLTILGTALIGMTFMNINMKYSDMRGKTSRYYSEAGIDEAYAIVAHHVDMALVYATEKTSDYLENDYKPNNPDLVYKDDGSLDDQHLQIVGDSYYRQMFKAYFQNYEDGGVNYGNVKTLELLSEISAISSKLDDRATDTDNTYTITVSESNLTPFAVGGDKMIIGDIVSTFSYLDITDQTISTDIVIKEPDMQYPLQILEEKANVLNNPLWQNVIVSNSDVSFNPGAGNSVSVEGDIFAKGTIPVGDIAKRNPDNYGGVTVSTGTLNVSNGDVVTGSYLQVKGNNAAFSLNNGNMFANTVVVQSSANGGSIQASNAQVFTADDLELNAPNGDITIFGSYFGFSSGNQAGATHDISSCIIVNYTTQARSNASVNITGDASSNPYGMESDEAGIYIAGTAYVNRHNDVDPYQTAESVAIETNYIFYRSFIADALVPEGHEHHEYAASYFVADGDEEDNESYFSGLSNDDGDIIYADLDDKANYFQAYYDVYSELGTTAGAMLFFDMGDGNNGVDINLNESNLEMSLGLYFGQSATPDVYEIKDGFGDYVTVTPILNNAQTRYEYYQTFLTNINEHKNLGSDINYTGAQAELDYLDSQPGSPTVLDLYTDSGFNFSAYTADQKNSYEVVDHYSLAGEDSVELIFVNDDPNITVHIGSGTNDANNVYFPADAEGHMQGVIITAGNIYMEQNNVDFVGAMIADGDIIIQSSGTTLTGYTYKHDDIDKDYETEADLCVLKMINKHEVLQDYFMFEPLLEAGGDNGEFNDNYGRIQFVYQDIVGLTAEADANRDRYNQLIYFDNWTID